MAPNTGQTLGRHHRLAESDDSDADDAVATSTTVLTVAKASDLCPKPFRLVAPSQQIAALDDLSVLKLLDYVDLSSNALTSLSGLSGNRRLKTLLVHGNRLTSVDPLLELDTLRVLNLSDNPLPTLDWLRRASFANQLLALVATATRLRTLDGIRALSSVRTLVFSRNEIEDLTPICSLTSLEKLSVSKNDIRKLPDALASLTQLRELRVAHNKLSQLPAEGIWRSLNALRILDVGHNRLSSLDPLRGCVHVVSVSVRGNPAVDGVEDIAAFIKTLCVNVEVVDTMRVAGGRRKDRINRLRVAAGMQVEGDRKFARAPPVAVVRKMVEEGATDALDEAARAEGMRVLLRAKEEQSRMEKDGSDASGDAGDNADASARAIVVGEEQERADDVQKAAKVEESGVRKRTRREEKKEKGKASGSEDDDDAIQADEFVKQAMAMAMPESTSGVVKKIRRKKKHFRREESAVRSVEGFGCGGESKW